MVDSASGEEVCWESGSALGAYLLVLGRMEYVPVSQMRSEPVFDEAVSMRWFYSCQSLFWIFASIVLV